MTSLKRNFQILMIKNNNVLITGGAGFIGSHLFERLVEKDNFALILDNFSSPYSENEKILSEILLK